MQEMNVQNTMQRTELRRISVHQQQKPKIYRKSGQQKAWKKPEGMPKRPLSAYNLFFRHEREKLLKITEETAKTVTGTYRWCGGLGMGFGPLARLIADKWKSLDQASRSTYIEEARKEKEKYRRAVAEWRNNESVKKSADGSSTLNMESSIKAVSEKEVEPSTGKEFQELGIVIESPQNDKAFLEVERLKNFGSKPDRHFEFDGVDTIVVNDEIDAAVFTDNLEGSLPCYESLKSDAARTTKDKTLAISALADDTSSTEFELIDDWGSVGIGESVDSPTNELIKKVLFEEGSAKGSEHTSCYWNDTDMTGAKERATNTNKEYLMHMLHTLQELHAKLGKEFLDTQSVTSQLLSTHTLEY